MKSQNTLITDGPQKGILVTPERYTEYYTEYNDIVSYPPEGKVLYWTPSTWLYLMTGNEFAAPSAWLSGDYEDQIMLLDSYYHINPDKFPDTIYCRTENGLYIDSFLKNCEYIVKETPNAYRIYYVV